MKLGWDLAHRGILFSLKGTESYWVGDGRGDDCI